jgi:hypothetical protein
MSLILVKKNGRAGRADSGQKIDLEIYHLQMLTTWA